MLDTVNTKAQHYVDGCFITGDGNDVIVILGSCRIMPYVNYFNRLNDGRFTICVINVVNFAFDASDNQVDSREFTKQFEDNSVLLGMIARCKWFIHEHAENFGIFNTSKESPKNIFQIGMNPEANISVPNFNDRFILFNDYQDCGVVAPDNYIEKGEETVKGFCEVCKLSSFPEMASYFEDHWRSTRFFWRPNHVSKEFTIYIFRRMNSRFLNLSLTDEFWDGAKQEDLFKEPHTQVVQSDIDGYGLMWS